MSPNSTQVCPPASLLFTPTNTIIVRIVRASVTRIYIQNWDEIVKCVCVFICVEEELGEVVEEAKDVEEGFVEVEKVVEGMRELLKSVYRTRKLVYHSISFPITPTKWKEEIRKHDSKEKTLEQVFVDSC